MIGESEIRKLIPHAGRMCLLREVRSWDEDSVICVTRTHRDPENPLRRNGRLAAVHLLEYGAQAMAIHGGLLARRASGQPAAPGLLSAMRDCVLHVERIDDIDAELTVRARRLLASAGGWMYRFEVGAAGRVLAEGRLSVIPFA